MLAMLAACVNCTNCLSIIIIRPSRCRSAAAYSDQTFPWTICRSVRRSVCLYVRRSVQCIVEKTADRIRMPFGIIGRTGPGMRQVVGFGDRSTGRCASCGEFGARHWIQWGLYGVRVRQCRDAALFPNYFAQTCYVRVQRHWQSDKSTLHN